MKVNRYLHGCAGWLKVSRSSPEQRTGSKETREREQKMAKVTIKDLLEAGVHFGHQTKRWNPKMKHFVYGARNGISIIDLTKTMRQISDACNFLQTKVVNGGTILFVGTKRQAQEIIKEAAQKTGMFYVAERWLGGTLTNNVTIRKSITKMKETDDLIASDAANSLKKKELSSIQRKNGKLHRDLDGIAAMKKLPDVIAIVDVCHDNIAVKEATKLNIPIVAIVDTNGDPEPVAYPIPANDDAVRSIKVIMDVLCDSIAVANEVYHKKVVEEKAKAEAAKAEKDAENKAKREKAEKDAKERAEKVKKAPVAKKKAAAPKKVVREDSAEKTKPEEAAAAESKEESKEETAEVKA